MIIRALSFGCVSLFAVTALFGEDDSGKAKKRPTELDWSSANRGSLSISAQEIKRAKVAADSFKTDYGSYDRDQLRVREIELDVWNSGKLPITITTEVLWFVTPEQPPKGRIAPAFPMLADRAIVGVGEIKPGQKLKYQAENSAVSNRTRYEALGESYASGVKFAGWVVLTRADTKILSFKASTPTLDRLVRQPVPAQGRTPLHEALIFIENLDAK